MENLMILMFWILITKICINLVVAITIPYPRKMIHSVTSDITNIVLSAIIATASAYVIWVQ